MDENYNEENPIILDYNTEREKLAMPEYGRNVLKMVEDVKRIEDRTKRSEQARAVVRVMEILNPQVHSADNWEQKLWDHLYIMAGYDLDVDSPYPMPSPEQRKSRPEIIPLKKKPIKATHYGRNIESIIDLIASEPEGEMKTAMIRSLAMYMRQQYLIWNKDSVADTTIFSDIEKLSDYRIKVPEGLTLSRISSDSNFSRPGMTIDFATVRKQGGQQKRMFGRKGNKR
ncbi:MAG: DUF4290 domain-containing protein [Bacteroidales bacterium]|nr:DUF4290 domain-containing protein [Bacteroidales bacterium]MDY5262753.1 DUF4290 domain-containing protein [Candidatus Cryptobacteroides sp.]MDY5569469.1 DUF4290 domain-containing protein [Candidatus Cryptobacteroides sp.]